MRSQLFSAEGLPANAALAREEMVRDPRRWPGPQAHAESAPARAGHRCRPPARVPTLRFDDPGNVVIPWRSRTLGRDLITTRPGRVAADSRRRVRRTTWRIVLVASLRRGARSALPAPAASRLPARPDLPMDDARLGRRRRRAGWARNGSRHCAPGTVGRAPRSWTSRAECCFRVPDGHVHLIDGGVELGTATSRTRGNAEVKVEVRGARRPIRRCLIRGSN
jgi:hypothetical protein